jgi:7,8-dihydropterin-6-yl-methyl-4-(beta-D-ribofuranosyl)aminobenzene 5'-phosphate synthase
MAINISEGIENGNLMLKVLTTNTVDVTLVSEDRFNGKVIQPQRGAIRAIGEHGLALLIKFIDDGETHNYLFDTGSLKSTIIENCKVFKVNLNEIDKLILSHGHYDHFGGLEKIVPQLKEDCEIYLNPECYYQTHHFVFKEGTQVSLAELSTSLEELIENGTITNHRKYPLLNKDLITNLARIHNVKLIETKDPVKLHKGIITSGLIELFNENEVTKGRHVSDELDQFKLYTARDETSIYINVKKTGLVIITGCAHAGIINTIKHAQKLTRINKLYAIIGGFHKANVPIETIEETIKFIEDLNPEVTCGMHCTGFEFNKRMSVRGHPSHTLGVTGTEFQL